MKDNATTILAICAIALSLTAISYTNITAQSIAKSEQQIQELQANNTLYEKAFTEMYSFYVNQTRFNIDVSRWAQNVTAHLGGLQ